MLQNFTIQGLHMEVDDNLRKYLNRKVGGIDKYIPRSVRESATAEVILKEVKEKSNKHCVCEINLALPHETINITESTVNMYAAIDIAEAKLKQRVHKYKDLHHNPAMHRRIIARFSRKKVPETPIV